jgi:endonuclease YncB( thermonuclease family)
VTFKPRFKQIFLHMFAAAFLIWLAYVGFQAVSGSAKAAEAPNIYPGPYLADVVSVYDGDTINVKIHVLPGQVIHAGLRVEGMDAPELRRSGCKTPENQQRELALGAEARDFVKARYEPGQRIRLRNLQQDKYGGRYVAIVERETVTGWQRLDDEMVRRGLADPYGARKAQDPLTKTKSWCRGEK